MSDWQEMLKAARRIDALYQAKDIDRIGRPWSLAEFLSQCAPDWGELAEQVGKHEGFRPGPYDQDAAAHELGDLLWALIVISDRMGIDLEEALMGTMDGLEDRLNKTGDAYQ
jgi:NTP pyrophosphatase (non-canonical NTP hydrolase)